MVKEEYRREELVEKSFEIIVPEGGIDSGTFESLSGFSLHSPLLPPTFVNIPWTRATEDNQPPFAIVTSVSPSSTAKRAGLEVGDMVVSFDTLDINDLKDEHGEQIRDDEKALEMAFEEIPDILTDEDVIKNGIIIEVVRDRRVLSLHCPSYTRRHFLVPLADEPTGTTPEELLKSTVGITLGPKPTPPSTRHEWDRHNPKIVPDPGYVGSYMTCQALNPNMAEYVAGRGWIGTTSSAVASIQRSQTFCGFCKRRGHVEDNCYVKYPSKCKTASQSASAAVKKLKRKKEEDKGIERRVRERKDREAAKSRKKATEDFQISTYGAARLDGVVPTGGIAGKTRLYDRHFKDFEAR